MARLSSATRSAVRQRADGRCEYCRLPDSISVYPFHVEHIRSKKHDGSDDLSNLCWACFQCNIAKGTDIASYDPKTEELTALFNPRTQIWDEHFEINAGEIDGTTPAGRVTVKILQMNTPEQIETRSRLINLGRW